MTRLVCFFASLTLALAVVWKATAFAQPPHAGGTEQLSADERERLEAGFLVTRPRSEQRGELRLIGGTSFQLIDLPTSAVWAEMDDPANYWQILPAARESRETAHDSPEDRVVFIRHTYGPASATYHVRMHFEPTTHTVVFRLAEDSPALGAGRLGLLPSRAVVEPPHARHVGRARRSGARDARRCVPTEDRRDAPARSLEAEAAPRFRRSGADLPERAWRPELARRPGGTTDPGELPDASA